VLHFEIGTVNNVLDSLCCFIEDQVEVISQEEKMARNQVIISGVSYTRAKEVFDYMDSTWSTIKLSAFDVEKVNINQALKATGLSEERRSALLEEKVEMDRLVDQQKDLQGDLPEKKKALSEDKCICQIK
jgi:hypothetical protein